MITKNINNINNINNNNSSNNNNNNDVDNNNDYGCIFPEKIFFFNNIKNFNCGAIMCSQ